jgi:hydroxymethylglutaryl-CoA synthase
VSLFSFGSGFASSFFTLRVKGDTSEISRTMNLLEQLSGMKVVPPQEFIKALEVCGFHIFLYCVRLRFIFLQLRVKNHNYTPEGLVENIWPGAYYLESADSKYRRKYVRAPL